MTDISIALAFVCMSCNQIPADGQFQWRVSEPILAVDQQRLPESSHRWVAVKDPSIVRFQDRWHLFCTLRKNKAGEGRIRIGYLSFDEWSDASKTDWSVLELTPGYHGAPQIFWFSPHRKWYLIYQAEDSTRGLKYGPCFSTNERIDDPAAWTLPEPLFEFAEGEKAGLDYWIICDEGRAHLFYTTLDGRMWRSSTSLNMFPDRGWTKPVVALQADIFEASHIYRLGANGSFLTVVEAQGNRRRYFKSFVAETLDGKWKPLANSQKAPFVSPVNVVNQDDSWATSYSHGEFLRTGFDEQLVVAPNQLRLLFQGANDTEYRERPYGQIPWRLGLLEQVLPDAP